MDEQRTRLQSWALAARPKTLTVALVPVMVGSALAAAEGSGMRWDLVSLATPAALLIQIGTNLVNDALDFTKGADTAERKGPIRITQAGVFSPRTVHLTGLLCFLAALLLCLPAFLLRGLPLALLVLLCCLAGYAYTGGPYPLAYHGFGDVTVVAFFGVAATAGLRFIHAGAPMFSWDTGVAGLQTGCLATVLLAVNNLRDIETDRKVAKNTLAVQFGPTFARCEIAGLMLVSYCTLPYWALGAKQAYGVALPMATAPIAVSIARLVWSEPPGEANNAHLARSALLHLCYGGMLALCILCCRR